MLSTASKKALHRQVIAAEKTTTAEIHIAFYKTLKGASVLVDAQAYFYRLQLHQNPDKNNVLIYLVESAQQFAILGDEDLHKKVGLVYWQNLCNQLSVSFKKGEVYEGLSLCIKQLQVDLNKYYPLVNSP